MDVALQLRDEVAPSLPASAETNAGLFAGFLCALVAPPINEGAVPPDRTAAKNGVEEAHSVDAIEGPSIPDRPASAKGSESTSETAKPTLSDADGGDSTAAATLAIASVAVEPGRASSVADAEQPIDGPGWPPSDQDSEVSMRARADGRRVPSSMRAQDTTPPPHGEMDVAYRLQGRPDAVPASRLPDFRIAMLPEARTADASAGSSTTVTDAPPMSPSERWGETSGLGRSPSLNAVLPSETAARSHLEAPATSQPAEAAPLARPKASAHLDVAIAHAARRPPDAASVVGHELAGPAPVEGAPVAAPPAAASTRAEPPAAPDSAAADGPLQRGTAFSSDEPIRPAARLLDAAHTDPDGTPASTREATALGPHEQPIRSMAARIPAGDRAANRSGPAEVPAPPAAATLGDLRETHIGHYRAAAQEVAAVREAVAGERKATSHARPEPSAVRQQPDPLRATQQPIAWPTRTGDTPARPDEHSQLSPANQRAGELGGKGEGRPPPVSGRPTDGATQGTVLPSARTTRPQSLVDGPVAESGSGGPLTVRSATEASRLDTMPPQRLASATAIQDQISHRVDEAPRVAPAPRRQPEADVRESGTDSRAHGRAPSQEPVVVEPADRRGTPEQRRLALPEGADGARRAGDEMARATGGAPLTLPSATEASRLGTMPPQRLASATAIQDQISHRVDEAPRVAPAPRRQPEADVRESGTDSRAHGRAPSQEPVVVEPADRRGTPEQRRLALPEGADGARRAGDEMARATGGAPPTNGADEVAVQQSAGTDAHRSQRQSPTEARLTAGTVAQEPEARAKSIEVGVERTVERVRAGARPVAEVVRGENVPGALGEVKAGTQDRAEPARPPSEGARRLIEHTPRLVTSAPEGSGVVGDGPSGTSQDVAPASPKAASANRAGEAAGVSALPGQLVLEDAKTSSALGQRTSHLEDEPAAEPHTQGNVRGGIGPDARTDAPAPHGERAAVGTPTVAMSAEMDATAASVRSTPPLGRPPAPGAGPSTVVFTPKPPQRLELMVKPPGMGPVTVDVLASGRHVRAHLAVGALPVAVALLNAEPHVQDRLQGSDLALQAYDVSVGSDGSGGENALFYGDARSKRERHVLVSVPRAVRPVGRRAAGTNSSGAGRIGVVVLDCRA